MASPSTDTLDEVDADDAIETFLDGIVISSSQQTVSDIDVRHRDLSTPAEVN
jgi:hypothetical protein